MFLKYIYLNSIERENVFILVCFYFYIVFIFKVVDFVNLKVMSENNKRMNKRKILTLLWLKSKAGL